MPPPRRNLSNTPRGKQVANLRYGRTLRCEKILLQQRDFKLLQYKIHLPVFAGALFLGLTCTSVLAQMPAFPGAQGFGQFATGGRGGSVYHVTNLNDTGAGSFRTGVTSPNRTVVFDVGGVIRITNVIAVASNVTIAGQTAPGDGITIYGNRLSYSGANNAITRFLRVRMGVNGDGNDTLTIASGHDMIFDHLSVSWGEDETFSISGSDPSLFPGRGPCSHRYLLSNYARTGLRPKRSVSIRRNVLLVLVALWGWV